jgi:hypothetical protein
VLIVLVTAATMEHRRTLRVVGVLGWIVAAVAAVGLIMFVLDALQTRAAVVPTMMLSFRVATFTAAAKMIIGVVAFAAFGRAGWRAGRLSKQPRARGAALVGPSTSATGSAGTAPDRDSAKAPAT